jgi:hypothetical protein
MTRGARMPIPPAGKAFQNLGEQCEARANSLATLQKLAAARQSSSYPALNATNTNFPLDSPSIIPASRTHWSNSGLVDLHPSSANNLWADSPLSKNSYASRTNIHVANTGSDTQNTVYVSSVEAKPRTDAKKIVQSYVDTLPGNVNTEDTRSTSTTGTRVIPRTLITPSKTSSKASDTKTPIAKKAVKNVSMQSHHETETIKDLKATMDKMSSAMTIMSDQQKKTATELKATQQRQLDSESKCKILEKQCKSLTNENENLITENKRINSEIKLIKKQSQEQSQKLLFRDLATENRRRP